MPFRDQIRRLVSLLADAYQVLGVPGLIAMASSFALPAWAASATDWVNAYGPIAWVFCGLIGVMFISSAALLWGLARERFVQARLSAAMAAPTYTVNPLEPVFRNQRLRASDFYNPFAHPHRNKNFIDCEFIGPASFVFFNSNIGLEAAIDCDFVEVQDGARVHNVIAFDQSTFTRCKFYKMTILAPLDLALSLRNSSASAKINWITAPPLEPQKNEP